MFWKKKSKKQLMTFDRSPRLSGKVNVCFGLPLLALWLLRCYHINCWTNGTTILSFAVLAYIIGSGVYRWALRRGAISDTVTLGGLNNRMYLRYGRLYIPLGFAVNFIAFWALVLLLTLIANDFKAVPLGDVVDIFTTLAWLIILQLYKVWKSYVDFYEFYRSPEASRKFIDWY